MRIFQDEKRTVGGKARWSGVPKDQRKAAAQKAAKARWAKRPKHALAK